VRLNNIQKYKDGERLAAGRPDAKSQFDPLSNIPLGTAAAPMQPGAAGLGGSSLPSML
jgi:hypothetical protein